MGRRERHLAYYTVIDQNRKILEQGSFNKMESSYKKGSEEIKVQTDYHKLLSDKEKTRDKARKSWTEIENIKELKVGYLSHLVHKMASLMIKHKAIVVFEDLNHGFKKGRSKFEKQVYQKLEKALIDKLNYLVFKDKESSELGSYLQAYQLTAPFESFTKMRKQTGWVFYIPAYYTSKADPLTGFVNLIYPKYENIQKSQKFFKKFEKIYFDEKNNYFVFEYQDGKINPSKKTDSKDSWRVCTHGNERYKWNTQKRREEIINVTEKLKKLFQKYNITYTHTEDLKSAITKQAEKDFFYQLTNLLKLTLQLRQNNPDSTEEKEQDFILSPVADPTGRFFDSRKAQENEPKNADANGAFHIALKGLWMIHQLTKQTGKKLKINPLKNKDWFEFIRNK